MQLGKELRCWQEAFLRAIPGRTGEYLRNRFGRYRCGARCRILQNVIIYYPERLTLGSDTAITAYCQINAGGGVDIGSNVLVGPGSFIWSQNHKFSECLAPIREQGCERAPVVIEDDVWIAARCVILPGVTIGRGSVIAAGAVVSKSIEPFSVAAGVPARVIRSRCSGEPALSKVAL